MIVFNEISGSATVTTYDKQYGSPGIGLSFRFGGAEYPEFRLSMTTESARNLAQALLGAAQALEMVEAYT